MRRYTLIFDFDGTILPSDPYDSEQTLLLSWLDGRRRRPALPKRLWCRLLVHADRNNWLKGSFKRHYLRLLRGTGSDLLDQVSARLAEKISLASRRTFASLAERGHRLIVSSCGTADLSERILRAAGIRDHFETVLGNRFVFERGVIADLRLDLPSPEAKLAAAQAAGIDPAEAVVIGDGPTDLPLLAWAGIPVVIESNGAKRTRWGGDAYLHISSIPEIVGILSRYGG